MTFDSVKSFLISQQLFDLLISSHVIVEWYSIHKTFNTLMIEIKRTALFEPLLSDIQSNAKVAPDRIPRIHAGDGVPDCDLAD
jgi:hypothetical protein